MCTLAGGEVAPRSGGRIKAWSEWICTVTVLEEVQPCKQDLTLYPSQRLSSVSVIPTVL